MLANLASEMAYKPSHKAPCLCGHPIHHRRKCGCGGCLCEIFSPDYVALAVAAGRKSTPREKAETKVMRLQTGWIHPNRLVFMFSCMYCTSEYKTQTESSRFCCGACRTATSRARALPSDDDVLIAICRRVKFSKERQYTTGYGTLGVVEQYMADLRVRAHPRQAH